MQLMNTPHDQLALLLHDATRLLRRRFERRAVAHGLSTPQWRLLAITLREGRVTQARLAERLEVEPISVSRLVDRMVEKGWVAREADSCDRRIRQVVPTEKARAAHGELRAMLGEVIAEAFGGFADEDKDRFMTALAQVVTNLSQNEAAECAAAKVTS